MPVSLNMATDRAAPDAVVRFARARTTSMKVRTVAGTWRRPE
jgi:hypothetical protein